MDRAGEAHVALREQALVNAHAVGGAALDAIAAGEIGEAKGEEFCEPDAFVDSGFRRAIDGVMRAAHEVAETVFAEIDAGVVELAAREGQAGADVAGDALGRAPVEEIDEVLLGLEEGGIGAEGAEGGTKAGEAGEARVAALGVVRTGVDFFESGKVADERIAGCEALIFLEKKRAVVGAARESGEAKGEAAVVVDVLAVGILQLGCVVFEDRGELLDGQARLGDGGGVGRSLRSENGKDRGGKSGFHRMEVTLRRELKLSRENPFGGRQR